MTDFELQRLGTIMELEPGNPLEIEGVLNPASARDLDGQLYLFPRVVSRGNYSRIGIARVRFDDDGTPVGVDRLGIVLEPEADYELGLNGAGGCEDPRITFVEPLRRYIMTYTAFSRNGPRIALAMSEDLFHWQRMGLATFEPYDGIEFQGIPNKDACVFPVAIPDPSGQPSMAILQRPLFPGTLPEDTACDPAARLVDIERESIWISYCSTAMPDSEPYQFRHFASHHRLASPVEPWERLKIGAGTPPILTRHGWLTVYHGVGELDSLPGAAPQLCYSAGVMILSEQYPQVIIYRSPEPILSPELTEERRGAVANVVFPTAIDRRDDIGLPDCYDVYYGMADRRIGVARLTVPEILLAQGHADAAQAKV